MITTLIVDDHPAVRQGLFSTLQLEPGIVPIGSAADSAAALALAGEKTPRCALVDLQLGSENGLELVRRLRALDEPPAVILYSAFAEPPLAIAAVVAGASAVVNKGGPLEDLIQTIKKAARGTVEIGLPPREAIDVTMRRVPADAQPVLTMMLNGASPPEVAAALRLSAEETERRVASMFDAFHELLWLSAPSSR